ncbi:MAG: hybrid sensor histidine kinase/response regulator [Aureliella sp.]
MNDQRVLVLAPERDGELTCEILARAGIAAVRCLDEDQFCAELQREAGAVVCAEESLSDTVRHHLKVAFDAQPPWSDLPMLVVAAPGDHGSRLAGLSLLPSIAVLSRPMAIDTLVTAVNSALRARRRQYQVRDLLRERDEASRRKDDFLAMLAHELRNPLAPVRYGVQVLRSQCAADDSELSHVLSLIERQVAHMAQLIEGLLDVSRLTRGAIELKQERIDLAQLARQVFDTRCGIAQSKGISMRFIEPERLLWVDGDSVRLTQVLDNLIDNAQKFSRTDGNIVVGAAAKADRAIIWVEDDGEGIHPRTLPHLFEAFSQADRSLDRSKGGLGLGLAIAGGIIAMHDGRIRAASDGPGTGAKFTFELPLAAEAPPTPAAQPQSAVAPRQTLKILIVEDNHTSAELLGTMLKHYGHKVEVAHNGPEGIKAAERFRPDVMLCDIGLPGMSGYEVARTLRARPDGSSPLLIALTGYGGSEHRLEALRAGFDVHLVKPVSPQDLLGMLKPSSHAQQSRH